MGLGISASACGRCHACACVFECICMRIRMCVGIYICAFFCSECYMHFTGVLGTGAWAGVFVTQVCFYTNVYICEHTRCRLCTYVYMYIRACAGVYVTQVYLYTLVNICEHTRCRLCTYVYMYIRVYMHAYAYGCVCVSMI